MPIGGYHHLDFQKAFDNVPYGGPITSKLWWGSTILLPATLSLWLKTEGISECEHSACAEVCSGIPQGSVLGPIPFLRYINDLHDAVKASMKLFANDG